MGRDAEVTYIHVKVFRRQSNPIPLLVNAISRHGKVIYIYVNVFYKQENSIITFVNAVSKDVKASTSEAKKLRQLIQK